MDRDYTYRLLRCIYNVYDELGPGLLESIYEEALAKELSLNGFKVERQVPIPVFYKGERLMNDMRLDLIIDNKIILELKSVVEYKKLFEKQLYTYLRLSDCELGYVVNFNVENIQDGIHAIVNRHDSPHKLTNVWINNGLQT